MNMKWKCMRLSEGGGRRGTWVSELMFKHSCFPLRKNNFPISGNKGGPTSQLLNTRPGILFWFPAPEMDLRLCCQNMMKGEIASIHIFLVGFQSHAFMDENVRLTNFCLTNIFNGYYPGQKNGWDFVTSCWDGELHSKEMRFWFSFGQKGWNCREFPLLCLPNALCRWKDTPAVSGN